MIDRIAKILGVKNIVSDDLIKKSLEKVNPKLKGFFSESAKYGYPIGAALGFLRSEFFNSGETDENLRPDEAANIERGRQREAPAKTLKTLGNIGLGAATGGALGAAASALGETLPEQNAAGESLGPETQAKELSRRVGQLAENVRQAPAMGKISPLNAANVASQAGKNVKEGLAKQALQGATGAAGFLSKHPELGRYIDDLINKGMEPEVAAEQAKQVKKFQPIISAIEKNIGDEFSSIIAQLFGKGQTRPSETAQKSTIDPDEQAFLDALNIMTTGRGNRGI